jgi:hypothetical protein
VRPGRGPPCAALLPGFAEFAPEPERQALAQSARARLPPPRRSPRLLPFFSPVAFLPALPPPPPPAELNG